MTESSIIVLDETTSRYVFRHVNGVPLQVLMFMASCFSMGWEIKATMQANMERGFGTQTVVSVMHHLRYTERFDRVPLWKHGQLVEFDSPQVLLARQSESAVLLCETRLGVV